MMVSSENAGPSTLRANEDKRFERFTSTTVHHLQESVRTMNLYTSMLQSASEGRLDAKGLQALVFLREAALQMQKLLDGMAELVTASNPTRKASKLRLELALRQALLNLEPELKASNARVSYADLPTVVGDFDQLQLVFQHLIRNAVHYRDTLPPEITISSTLSEQTWILKVRDNGPGIALEYHERIFEMYARLHGKSIPGNGLGLSICRTIVESHEGSIWVESHPGEGACFCFTLPVMERP